ncbi:MAG: SH3 domain-containing protein [Sedimentisphaerales bacterium]|nr:SH3 domain-containing protein [Sedimentisphaerales bacterium]
MKVRVFIVLLTISVGTTLAGPMSVRLRTTQVRATPSHLGSAVATVTYGDVVQAGSKKNGWYPVATADGKMGWLHEGALTKKAVTMRAGVGDTATGASQDEVALAGKGFNEQVEAEVRKKGTLDYTWVDRMAAFNMTSEQLMKFRLEGHLPGGAR